MRGQGGPRPVPGGVHQPGELLALGRLQRAEERGLGDRLEAVGFSQHEILGGEPAGFPEAEGVAPGARPLSRKVEKFPDGVAGAQHQQGNTDADGDTHAVVLQGRQRPRRRLGHAGAHVNHGERPRDAVGDERPRVGMPQRPAQEAPARMGTIVGRENVGVFRIAQAALATQPHQRREAPAENGPQAYGEAQQGKAAPFGTEPGGEPGGGRDHGGPRHGDGLLVLRREHDGVARIQLEIRRQAQPLPARTVNFTAGAADHAAHEKRAESQRDAQHQQSVARHRARSAAAPAGTRASARCPR